MHATRRTCPRGFTLVELLVVIAIIALISAVALPMVLPALNERRVSESARLLQAILAGTRDAAIRANAPRGIRLLPDPIFNGQGSNPLASNRIIPIEPAPDYSEGLVDIVPVTVRAATGSQPAVIQLQVQERLYANYSNVYISQNPVPSDAIISNPTSWYWNLRQGDRIRFNDSGPYYTIAGPMTIGPNSSTPNTDRFINNGPPASVTFPRAAGSYEYLIVTNGLDDDLDGFTDESFDGLDNDGDGIVDPAYNGLDDDGNGTVDDENTFGEYENEKIIGALASAPSTALQGLAYTISRRPIVSPGARETTLPEGIVIDMTTWNAPTSGLNPNNKTIGPVLQPERSRVPVDPYTHYVDIMISPSGQVVQGGAGSGNSDYNSLSPGANQPFYHFWLTEREGVMQPLFGSSSFLIKNTANAMKSDGVGFVPNLNPNYGSTATSQNYVLPMPKDVFKNNNITMPAPYDVSPVYLTGERRLVTLFVKTGQIVSNSIENFNVYDTNAPFYDAQTGTKESQ